MNTEIQNLKLGQSNEITARNHVDANGNPAGGYAHGKGLCVSFQDGPRGKLPGGDLLPSNGAFVEDLLVAARQRLCFFQDSKFAHPNNQSAIESIDAAIQSLHRRACERADRGVLGKNEV